MKIKDLLLLVEGFEKTNERLEKLESLIKRINVTVFKCTECSSITLLGTCSDKTCEDRSNWDKEDKPTIADPHEHIWLTDGGCARFLCTLTKKEFDEKTKPKDSELPSFDSDHYKCVCSCGLVATCKIKKEIERLKSELDLILEGKP